MKKKLLILAMCLFSALSANAANWVALDGGSDDAQVFIDTESIKFIKADTCTYALLHKKGNEAAKAVYIKSNYSNDTAGIIRVEDFSEETYNPGFYSKHTSAFMKDAMSNSLLNAAHNFALSTYSDNFAAGSSSEFGITNLKNVSNYLPDNAKLGLSDEEYNAYVDGIKSALFENWKTSVHTVFTDINLVISVNSDGSFNGYRILKSTGDDRAKRAAIAAVNLSAPFTPFPDNAGYMRTVNIPVTFEQKFFKKRVK